MELGLEVTGVRTTVLRFESFPAKAHDRLLATLTEIEARLEAAVLADEPSKTGALRQLTGGRVYDHGNRIAAVVGVNVKAAGNVSDAAQKATALEYGSHGNLSVRVHFAMLNHLWSRAISPIQVMVGQHFRQADIEARRFLRDPIEAMREEALSEMRAALDAAVADAR